MHFRSMGRPPFVVRARTSDDSDQHHPSDTDRETP
jgi:hypothetical protein